MFCPQCGQPYAEGMRFCEHCGATLPPPAAPGVAPQAGMPGQPLPAQRSGPVSVLELLRRLATSPLYLTGAIAYTCFILFNLVSATSGSTLERLMDQYLSLLFRYGNMGMGELGEALDQLNSVMPLMRGATLGTALVGQIPAILIAVGLWMLFASAKNRSGEPLKATGLTIIKVITIINLVVVSLAALLVVVVLFLVMAALASYEDAIVPAFLAVIVLVAAIFALAILFYVKLATTIHTMQTSIRTGMPSDRVSAYVAVIAILGGVGSLMSILGAGGVSGMLAMLGAAVAAFCYGIFLFRYRKEMRLVMGKLPLPEYSPEEPPILAYQPVHQSPDPQPVYTSPEPAAPAPQPVYTAPEPAAPAPQPVYTPPEPAAPAPQPVYTPPEPVFQETPTTPVAPTNIIIPETTVLNAAPRLPNLQLIHVRDGSSVTITQPRFRIGRDPSAVDYIINDNTAVGRQHADLLLHDGACYVVDLNSTNHTYLNGEPLNPGTEYPLQDGDEILLGNEAFQVRLS